MADYIYLLENRLSFHQRAALRLVREVARSKGLTVFLVGGAVRDLTSGSPVRDLDVVVQGNALKLKKDIEKAGVVVTGENESTQALYLRFPGNVRVELGTILVFSYPKPGKVVVKSGTILEDLRRRDFTANAMALSLNEGSYGLLMDPLNGVADIENRQLRLVSNYGFINDPVTMIRAARLMARLGWILEEKTQARYDTGKEEGYISAMQETQRGYELEEIVHEEDPLRIMKRLETEGWLKTLAPYWSVSKVNTSELERVRDVQTQLQVQGIHPDPAAANFPFLTAKLAAKEVATLKASFPRQGFVQQIEALEAESKEFAALLSGKGAASASQAWKLMTGAAPESVLWTAFSTKSAALQQKFQSFYTEWPLARQKMPYTMMQEMRIVPDLAGYDELLEKLFFELMDGNLSTPEEMKAYLEPFSPPAPPPPMSMRRPRAAKKEAKPVKPRVKKAAKMVATESVDNGIVSVPVVEMPVEVAAKPAKAAPAAKPVVEKTVAAKPAVAKPLVTKKAEAKVPAPVVKKAAVPAKPAAKTAAETASKSAAKPIAKAPAKSAKAVVPAKKPLVAAKKPATSVAKGKAVSAKALPKKIVAKKAVAKKAVPAKKVVAKKAAPAKKVVAQKKAVVVKKALPAKKAAPTKKAAPVKKSAPTKKAVVPAKKKVVVKGKRR